jgi:hypothetical protein
MVVAGDEPQGLFALGALESTAAVRIPETLVSTSVIPVFSLLFCGAFRNHVVGVLNAPCGTAFVDYGPLSPELEGMPVYREEMMLVAAAGPDGISRN